MNVTHLKAFYEVAKAKSFTLAARQLNVSQPTLSMQVMSLEKRFSVPLIKRNRKTFDLTDEGIIVFQHAEKIFGLLHKLKKELENFETGQVIIGSTPYISNHILPSVLLAAKEQNPGTKIQIFTGLSQEVLAKVADYEYHFAVIGRLPYPDNIVSIPILKSKLLFISKEDLGSEVSLEQLANHSIILPERGSATRDYLINEFHKRNLTLTNTIDCENPPAIRDMVELGIGGAFFNLFSIQKDVQEGRFHMASVREDLTLHYDLVFLRDRRNSQTVRIFRSVINKLKSGFST